MPCVTSRFQRNSGALRDPQSPRSTSAMCSTASSSLTIYELDSECCSAGGPGSERTPTLERKPSGNHTVVHHAALEQPASPEKNASKNKGASVGGQARNGSVVGSHLLGAGAGQNRAPPRTRSKKLDIIIAHYDVERIDAMKEFWLWFFDLQTVSP